MTGPGIPRPRTEIGVFSERFTRLDDARAGRDGGGGEASGSRSFREISAVNGGTVTLSGRFPGPEGGRVRLPWVSRKAPPKGNRVNAFCTEGTLV